MLEALVGTTFAVLVVIGLVIAFGPAIPRRRPRVLARRLRPRPAPAPLDPREPVLPGLHPTTQRAVQAATRISAILRADGFPREANDVRAAARLLGQHEAEGLRALRRLQVELQALRLEDEGAYLRFRRLLAELKQHVGDRAEQLELLPF